MHALFTPFGPLHSVHLPKGTPRNPPPPSNDDDDPSTPSTSTAPAPKILAKGFAFVWFLSKKDAEVALDKMNETKVLGGIAQTRLEGGKRKKAVKELKKKTEDEGRTIAVDWALSKERWAEMEKAEAEAEAREEMSSEEESGSESGSHSGSQDGGLGVHEDGESDEGGDSGSGSESDEEIEDAEVQHPPQPEEGTTLFLRNVPFEAGDDDLKEL